MCVCVRERQDQVREKCVCVRERKRGRIRLWRNVCV